MQNLMNVMPGLDRYELTKRQPGERAKPGDKSPSQRQLISTGQLKALGSWPTSEANLLGSRTHYAGWAGWAGLAGLTERNYVRII